MSETMERCQVEGCQLHPVAMIDGGPVCYHHSFDPMVNKALKPLHVQVAEAVGWTGIGKQPTVGILLPEQAMPGKGWIGWRDGMVVGERVAIPDYDTDWSATGPLIEKYKLHIWPIFVTPAAEAVGLKPEWAASQNMTRCSYGPTPLEAVCRFVVSCYPERE